MKNYLEHTINISNSQITNASKIISDAVIEYSNIKVETGSDEIAYQNAINKFICQILKLVTQFLK